MYDQNLWNPSNYSIPTVEYQQIIAIWAQCRQSGQFRKVPYYGSKDLLVSKFNKEDQADFIYAEPSASWSVSYQSSSQNRSKNLRSAVKCSCVPGSWQQLSVLRPYLSDIKNATRIFLVAVTIWCYFLSTATCPPRDLRTSWMKFPIPHKEDNVEIHHLMDWNRIHLFDPTHLFIS